MGMESTRLPSKIILYWFLGGGCWDAGFCLQLFRAHMAGVGSGVWLFGSAVLRDVDTGAVLGGWFTVAAVFSGLYGAGAVGRVLFRS